MDSYSCYTSIASRLGGEKSQEKGEKSGPALSGKNKTQKKKKKKKVKELNKRRVVFSRAIRETGGIMSQLWGGGGGGGVVSAT